MILNFISYKRKYYTATRPYPYISGLILFEQCPIISNTKHHISTQQKWTLTSFIVLFIYPHGNYQYADHVSQFELLLPTARVK